MVKKTSKKTKTAIIIIAVIIALPIVGIGGYLVYKKFSDPYHSAQWNMDRMFCFTKGTKTSDQIDQTKIEEAIRNAIITKTPSLGEDSNGEAHKTLRAEIRNGQIYAYVVARYGTFLISNGTYENGSGSEMPFRIIFDIKNGDYIFNSIDWPSDGNANYSSLKAIFPCDLIPESYESIDDATVQRQLNEFYKDAIKEYSDNIIQ